MLDSPASGKFVLRLRSEVHTQLRAMAAARNTSLNTLCAGILEHATSGNAPENAGYANGFVATLLAQVMRFEAHANIETRGVVLFGSASRGELRSSSDIDLLIVVSDETPLRRHLYRSWAEVESEASALHEVSPHFVHIPQNVDQAGSLWMEVALEGVILMDREGKQAGETQKAMRKLRNAIAAGEFSRSFRHGHPYWSRNP